VFSQVSSDLMDDAAAGSMSRGLDLGRVAPKRDAGYSRFVPVVSGRGAELVLTPWHVG